MKFKLSRKFQARKRLVRNQLSSLFLYGRIKTTKAKAKALKSEAQKLVSDLKNTEGHNLVKRAREVLYGGASKKAVDIIASVKSISILSLPPRLGDGASSAIVVLNVNSNEFAKPLAKKELNKNKNEEKI